MLKIGHLEPKLGKFRIVDMIDLINLINIGLT